MGIRIQPREIEIPEDDPFKNDLLNRREPISVLTHIIGSIEGPCVIAVDAPWGAGKTTFLKIWEQHLLNEEFPVVSYNAWETDFSDDPFIALSAAISQELEQYEEESLGDRLKKFKTLAGRCASYCPSGHQSLLRGLVDVTPLMDLLKEIPEAVASKTSDRLAAYENAQELLNDLSIALQGVARDLAKSKNGLPLVIVIDELDRCRPSYAVELLETAKHIFAVDNIVFVLAVNRSELAHSVRALYGIKFDAIGYLNRFFDIDFRLPEPARGHFIGAAIKSTPIYDYFNNARRLEAHRHDIHVREMLSLFFDVSGLSLRIVEQAIHRFGLVLASSRDDEHSIALGAAVALIIRAVDRELYQKFTRGDIEDTEVADSIFKKADYAPLRQTPIGRLFEAAIIIARWEMRDNHLVTLPHDESPLIARYKGHISEKYPVNADYNEIKHYADKIYNANEIVKQVDLLSEETVERVYLRFMDAVRHLELFSREILDVGIAQH